MSWITLHAAGDADEGTVHVFIGAGGRITKGPASLIGAALRHLAAHARIERHPAGHEPAGARDHPQYRDHQPPEKPTPKPGKPYAREHGAAQTRQHQPAVGPEPLSAQDAYAGLQTARAALHPAAPPVASTARDALSPASRTETQEWYSRMTADEDRLGVDARAAEQFTSRPELAQRLKRVQDADRQRATDLMVTHAATLPALHGSEKQVQWAQTIHAQQLHALTRHVAARERQAAARRSLPASVEATIGPDRMGDIPSTTQADAAVAFAQHVLIKTASTTDARTWIDRRQWTPAEHVRHTQEAAEMAARVEADRPRREHEQALRAADTAQGQTTLTALGPVPEFEKGSPAQQRWAGTIRSAHLPAMATVAAGLARTSHPDAPLAQAVLSRMHHHYRDASFWIDRRDRAPADWLEGARRALTALPT